MLVMGVGLNVDEFVVIKSPIRIIVRIVGKDGTDKPPVELIKAAVEWSGFRIEAVKMPLVDETSLVTGTSEYGGDGCVGRQEIHSSDIRHAAIRTHLLSFDTSCLAEVITNGGVSRVFACQQ